jgi:uncharacterized BrkB/YihY/UPF0761 family membrane protein
MTYQPPPPSVPPYGPEQPYGYGYPPPGNGVEHPQGTTVLVLGILSLVVCGILGPFAWSMGNKALREIDAAPPGYFRNRGNVSAGRICGIVATILLIVAVLVIILVFGVVASVSSSSSSSIG